MVSESNAIAYQRLIGEPANATKMLCLCGPQACGKTHLATLWAQRNDAITLAANAIGTKPTPELIGAARAVIVENLDQPTLQKEEAFLRSLFHLVQHCISESISLLITSKTPPNRWNLPLADLQSRLALMELVTLNEPDDMLMEMVLMKHFSDRQLRVSQEVRTYIMKRIDRSFFAIAQLVAQLDDAALTAKRDITLPFVKQVWH